MLKSQTLDDATISYKYKYLFTNEMRPSVYIREMTWLCRIDDCLVLILT